MEISNSEEADAITYKIMIIGDSSVGKTCLFKKLSSGTFHDKNISTIGVEKVTLDYKIDVENKKDGKKEKKSFSISLFDTAGQEKFRAVTFSYYKESDGILLLYDITKKDSFDQVSFWIDSIKEAIDSKESSKYAVILIGNKLDLVGEDDKERQVWEKEAMDACDKYDLIWGGELSTKDIEPEKLNELFEGYVREIYQAVGVKKFKKQTTKQIGKYKKKKSGCFGVL